MIQLVTFAVQKLLSLRLSPGVCGMVGVYRGGVIRGPSACRESE